MTSREIVRRSLYFGSPSRLPVNFPDGYGNDFYQIDLDPPPDARRNRGTDEWGCVWDCLSEGVLGEVVDHPLKSWDDFKLLNIPDVKDESRYGPVKTARREAGDKYVLLSISSIYERVHFLRGVEDTWIDLMESPDKITMLVGLLADMNTYIIRHCSRYGVDGILMGDDWGLQNRLMINPELWREIWKPAYKRIFGEAHSAGMDVFFHSCGYIVDILDDLIEVGLNAIHMDQQENMGLENLGARFGGRITFFAPVDIQKTMVLGSAAQVRDYCRDMFKYLCKGSFGLIPRWYGDPVAAGHSEENLGAMCSEFLKIIEERRKKF